MKLQKKLPDVLVSTVVAWLNSRTKISTIAEKLALAGGQDAKLYKGIPDHQPEDWRDYLIRLRKEDESGETLVDEFRRAEGKRSPADELAPRVEARPGGLYWITPKIDKQYGEVIRPGQWLCGPVDVLGSGEGGRYRLCYFALAVDRKATGNRYTASGKNLPSWRLR